MKLSCLYASSLCMLLSACGSGTLRMPTATFTASPRAIEPGQSTTLAWRTTNATALSISGIGVVQPDGQQSVMPATTTTYTLTATGLNGTTQASTTVIPVNVIFSDSFDRPDQQGLGNTPQGQPWMITGCGDQLVAISSNHYVDGTPGPCNGSYAGIQMNQQPIHLGGKISFLPSGTNGTGSSAIALISSKDIGIQLQNMVHLVVTRYGVGLTWWQGANQDNTPTSCTGSNTFASPLRTDGTSYPVYMTIVGNTVTVDKPDGNTYVCTDTHFSQLAGTLGIWELQYSTSTKDMPRWDKAEAFSAVQ